MSARHALFGAKLSIFLLGAAAALALFHVTAAAIVIGLGGTILNLASLIWLLRQETRR